MLEKKICMLGTLAVGKTSLVRQFIEGIYSEGYQTSIGVKVDKKIVREAGQQEVTLVLWDIYGEDDYQKMRWTYLRGASGYLLVADGTRKATLEKAVSLEQKVRELCPTIADIELTRPQALVRNVGGEEVSQCEGRPQCCNRMMSPRECICTVRSQPVCLYDGRDNDGAGGDELVERC